MVKNFSPQGLHDIPGEAVFILGAGHFGNRAARLTCQQKRRPIFVIDIDEDRLAQLEDLPVSKIRDDGIHFLVGNYQALKRNNTVVPAIPIHLLYEWLKGHFKGRIKFTKIAVPGEIIPFLPNAWPGSEGSLLVSYADFHCPDDCPEPEYCTVTGEKREMPLYRLIGQLKVPQYRIHVVRSHQLAPGLGGYKVADLINAAEVVEKNKEARWLFGTACKCHGILTAAEVIVC